MPQKLRKVFTPEGCRLLVDDVVSETTMEHRAEKIGISIVLDQKNRPKNTLGIIVAIGADPMLYDEIIVEGYKRPRYMIGDEVTFDWHAGKLMIIEGHEFRSLELQEIQGCFRQVPDSAPETQSESSSSVEPAAQSELRRYLTPAEDPFDSLSREPLPSLPVDKDLEEPTLDSVPSQSEPPRLHSSGRLPDDSSDPA